MVKLEVLMSRLKCKIKLKIQSPNFLIFSHLDLICYLDLITEIFDKCYSLILLYS